MGPAIIDSIVLKLDGKLLENSHDSWKRLFDVVGLSSADWHLARIGIGSVLRPNEEVWLFRADRMPAAANDVIRALSRVSLEVEYSSLYEDRQAKLIEGLARVDLIVGAEDQALPIPRTMRI